MKSKLIWILAIIAGLLLLIYVGGSWYFGDLLINRSTSTLADSQAAMAELGLPVLSTPENVTIQNGDVSLTGFFYDNEKPGECAVILLHGYTGTRYSALQYAPLFWERGCDLLAYDARGHGESSPAFHTYGYHEKQDAQAAYAWLLARTGLEPEQVGLTGVSYGAATSLQAAPLLPETAFIIADSAYESLEAIVSRQAVEQFGSWTKPFIPVAFAFASLRADFDVNAVSPKAAVNDTAVPILLIHSRTDAYTPYTHSEAIYANSNPATTVLHITDWGSAHGRDIFTDFDAFKQLTDEFLAEYAPDFGISDGR
ncbi:MAG TPA: alpha/beta fold hydrolase [Chloroflexota bacterium]|nr:alpha/beta fold hydrolase [Chloroflexota bacterium]